MPSRTALNLTEALWFGRRAMQDGFVAPDALLEVLFAYIDSEDISFREHLIQAGLMTVFQCESLEKRIEPMPEGWTWDSQAGTSSASTSNRYELGEIIQQGGVGRIYRAYDQILGRNVAVKCLLQPDDKEAQRRFALEYRITGRLEHPNIISVHDASVSEDLGPYYVMRLLEGQTLQDVLRRAHEKGVPGRTSLLHTFLEICAAIAYAHNQGVIHRDLKPTNIMVGELGEAQVMDWGIARQLIEENLPTISRHKAQPEETSPLRTSVMGTPGYMAPEQARGQHALDERADIFSLGCILYEILTGHIPFRGSHLDEYLAVLEVPPISPKTHNPVISTELNNIVLRAIAIQPQDRYGSVRELSTALTLYLEGTKTRKLREQRALARVIEGIQARSRLEQCEAEAETILGELRGEQSRIRPHDPLDQKQPLWEKEKNIERLEKEAMVWLEEATSVFTQALALDADCQEAHNQLADLYHGRLLAAERRKDAAQQVYHEAMLQRHNDGRYDDFLKGEGTVWMLSDPPGVQVTLHRLEEEGRILTPQKGQPLGQTPLGPLVLPVGSYLAVLQQDGFQTTQMPLLVQRDQRNIYRARLYKISDCPDGFVYMPQGRFLMGGDPLTASAGRVERPFVQDLWVAKYPVTIGEYLDFLNAIQKQSDSALPHVPRRSPGGGYYLPQNKSDEWMLPEMDEDGDVWDPQWPVFAISWHDADAYATWRGQSMSQPLRLPLSMELEKAARGVDGRFYPWGDHFDATFCKMGKSQPGPPKPEPVGAYDTDVSIYGVRDLAGGIREWCSDEMDPSDGAIAFGGNWSGSELTSRAAHRWFLQKGQVAPGIGLRLAMEAPAMPYHKGFPDIEERKSTRVNFTVESYLPSVHQTSTSLQETLANPQFWDNLVRHQDNSALAWLAQAARTDGSSWAMIQGVEEETPLAIAGDAPDPLPASALLTLSTKDTEATHTDESPARAYTVYSCGEGPLGYLVLPSGIELPLPEREPLCAAIAVVLHQRQERKLSQLRESQAQTEAKRMHRELTIVREAFATIAPDTYLRENYPLIDGRSPAMRQLFRMLDRLTQSDVNVLIRGESGVGKERVALTIHQNGSTQDGSFVAVNCGAIPENLVESELFGHVKGAFTGAEQDRSGLFRQAHNGTLFLDEIGELTLDAQVKLLRALQNRTVRPVGGTQEYPFKARILAATHRDLKQMVEDETFREDLYWRLVVVEIEIPPLRQRPEDIPLLVSQFLSSHQDPPDVTEESMECLQQYKWPGNIRELENEINRALVVADGSITPSTLSRKLRDTPKADSNRLQGTLRDIVAQVEHDAILIALQQCDNNKAETARRLGLSKRGLQLKLKRYDI